MALDLEIDILRHGNQRLVDRIAKTFGGDAVVVRELRRLRGLNNAAEVINEAREDGALLSFCGGRHLVLRSTSRRSSTRSSKTPTSSCPRTW